MNKVAVVGGGASGMAAALAAAECGASVTILEKNQRVGKKLLSTGNGRCNFTNTNAGNDNYNSDFVSFALEKFSPEKTIDFFEKLGLFPKFEEEGRVYPYSEQASAVLDVLRMGLDRAGIKIRAGFDVSKLVRKGKSFEITSKSGDIFAADKVILATGGKAAPKTGSTGAGYDILTKLGHTVTPRIAPALTRIKTDRGIQGVRAYGRVTLEDGNTRTGEIQFGAEGLSGIPVFCISKYAKAGEKIFVDLMPDIAEYELAELLRKRPRQTMETYLVGILNKALGQMLLKECGISPLSRMSDTLSEREIRAICGKMKKWEFRITGTASWDIAQVTSGGAVLEEFDPKTMQSRLIPGLYAVGELLDIDGDCGGYNLQWAWSSGFAAGGDAARV